jgi:hypothetical protein
VLIGDPIAGRVPDAELTRCFVGLLMAVAGDTPSAEHEEEGQGMESEEQSTLVVLTTGKEAFVRANAVLQMTLMVRKTAQSPVKLLLLGQGVEVLRSNQKNSPQFEQQLAGLREAGVEIAVCEVSLESLGLTKDQMFEAEAVKGGVEVANRLQEGWHVLTF